MIKYIGWHFFRLDSAITISFKEELAECIDWQFEVGFHCSVGLWMMAFETTNVASCDVGIVLAVASEEFAEFTDV